CGPDLSSSLDNWWFTLLFRRPRWYAHQCASGGAGVRRGLRILAEAMLGRLRPSAATLSFLAGAIAARARSHEEQLGGLRWPVGRAGRMLAHKGPDPSARAWGWKAPITHVYLPELVTRFPELR